MSDLKTSGTQEERLNYYATKALPNSLNNISRRSKALTEYVEYLEQSYLKADTQEEQSDVETQAKGYLVDALQTVVGDISETARNLEQFVELQTDAVTGLTTQVDLLKTKMALYKEQHGTEKFNGYRENIVTESGTYKRKLNEEDLQKSYAKLSSVLVPAVHNIADHSSVEEKKDGEEIKVDEKDRKPAATRRVPLKERLARFDDVGECLDRERDSTSSQAQAVRSSSVLRRSSYNKGSNRRMSQLGENDDATVSSAVTEDGNDDDVSVSIQGSKRAPPPRLSTMNN